jgi:FkbM family methyltransferase
MRDWRFYLSRRMGRKYLYGLSWHWESSLESCGTEDFNDPIILKKGKVFIDGGASYGYWSIRASRFYDRIYSFEPDRKTFKVLKANLRMNGIRNVTPINAALGMERGKTRFFEQGNGESSILANHMGKNASGSIVTIDMVKIDDLDINPDMIKLDVEGAELQALFGAKDTIERCGPELLIEVHEPVTPKAVLDSLPDYQWEWRWRYLNIRAYPFVKQAHLYGVLKTRLKAYNRRTIEKVLTE